MKLKLEKTYDRCASGKPKLTVVLIHGIASDSTTYNSALEHLEKVNALKNVRFVTFDLLGSGKSLKNDSLNYDYKEQIEALHNSIEDLKIQTPLVLVGHSLGTFIVTRYAETYQDSVSRLVLLSPPIYTPKDLKNPAFAAGIEAFKQMVSFKNPAILKEKSFINSMDNIVLAEDNYETLAKLKAPTILIYGNEDQLIASYNIPKLLKENSGIAAIRTNGRHGVSSDKFVELEKILREDLDA